MFLFIAGMLSGDRDGNVVGAGDFDAQCIRVFANVHAAQRSFDADWSDVVQSTNYMVHFQSIAAG